VACSGAATTWVPVKACKWQGGSAKGKRVKYYLIPIFFFVNYFILRDPILNLSNLICVCDLVLFHYFFS